ncbi:MAG: DEAD/DEAH box helicase [Chloroflexi bacterium]|nr:DEAD/DEAH box helicase [Chloroflexota bacterium]
MASTASLNVPEQGQLVEVRRRRYIVTDVAKSALPISPLALGNSKPQHLVALTSIEDDALGEELQVIWEVEPGARVYEKMALPEPTGFDEPRRLDSFLNAVRWGAASSADTRALQSPFRSGIDIEDYQLDPVVRAVQMPRANLLIADDVGLGKTIEAGLVVQEMIIRHRVRRVLIVCPSALQIQWRDQMRDKFGLEFRIVDSSLMKELRRRRGIHVNPWTHFPRLITSIDFLKRERPMRLFRETLPAEGELAYPRRFDMLIVDEAHNVAPSGKGRYAIDSLRTAAVRVLSPHFENKLFLTATPHNGYAESFSALLELLDNQRFARGVRPDRELLGAVMVRRLKTELPPRWDGTPRFPARKLEAIEVACTEQERQTHRWLHEYTHLRQQHPSDPLERTVVEFVLKLLKKRLFSSPAAFASTLTQHEAALAEASTASPASRAFRKPSPGILRAMIDTVEEEYGDDDGYEDSVSDAVRTTTWMFHKTTAAERELLDKMRKWADRASARPDSKAQTLIDWLKQTVRPNGQWSDERVIVFTEYRTTQNWLQTLLAAEGLTQGERLMTLYGGMNADERERIKAAFQASPKISPVRILLATDAASEGIDLQLHCHRLIHYEIPWNPNRMEQRNGRIDRHGQLNNPLVFHFVPKAYQKQNIDHNVRVGELEGDLEFLARAVQKVEQIREDLGKVGPVIADQVTEAMLGRRSRLETEAAERGAEPVRRLLKFERNLRAQIEKLHNQLQDTERSLSLSPENVLTAVHNALELAGQLPLQEAELEGVWPDPTGQRRECPVFRLPPLRGSWARCGEGLAHPHTGEIRPIVFDHNLSRGRDDVVLVHLNHPLVQKALRLLRAEVWSTESSKRLNRVTARLVPDHLLSEPVAVAHARLVITGGDSHALHEEIISVGGEIHQGRFRRLDIGAVQDALVSALDAEPSSDVKRRVASVWPSIAPSLRQALDSRMRDRVSSLRNLLAARADKEVADITAILTELEKAIRSELVEPEYVQLEMFSPSEREQYSRNIAALEARLAQIPGEIEQEAANIRARFADPQPRLFPVAVTFLVPQRLSGGAHLPK